MEAQDLRKLRIAHGLTPSQLAEMLEVPANDILCWEAPEGSPHHKRIDTDTRRRILRQLAIYRDRQKERKLVAVASANPRRFTGQPFVPSLVADRYGAHS